MSLPKRELEADGVDPEDLEGSEVYTQLEGGTFSVDLESAEEQGTAD